MRKEPLIEDQIISFIIAHEKLSKAELFKLFENSNQKTDEEQSKKILDSRTLDKYCRKLENDGIIEKENMSDKYRLNKSFFADSQIPPKQFNEFMQMLLQNKELDLYIEMRRFINGVDIDENYDYTTTLSNHELELYKSSVKIPFSSLNATEDIMKQINRAIRESMQIHFFYKGNAYSLYPVCYLISRDSTKLYLLGMRKKKLENFELSFIERITYGKPKQIDTKEIRNKIKKIWDKDITESNRVVKIMLIKNSANYQPLKKELKDYFHEPSETTEQYDIFKGEIIGINDFKHWLRRNITSCIVLEPPELKKEILEPLKIRLERYGEKEHEQ